MKKETRTTRLSSKKQGKKIVSLGMAVTLFAPLLLAPIAYAEEVQTTQTSEVAQQPVETAENSQASVVQESEPVVEEEIVTDETLPVAPTEVSEEFLVEETVEPVIVEEPMVVGIAESEVIATEVIEESQPITESSSATVEAQAKKEPLYLDRTLIEQAYTLYSSLNEENYTPESWTAFMSILNTPRGEAGITILNEFLGMYAIPVDQDYSDNEGLKDALQSNMDSTSSLIITEIGKLVLMGEEPKETPVTGITISKSETSLKVGESEDLTATITPDNATNKNVSWSSSDESVATFANGKVTAKAKGTATITVTSEDGGKTDTCVVTVTEDVTPPVDEKLNLDALKAAIAAADPLKEADYTPESWGPFAKAKANAEAVLAKAEAQNAKAALTQVTVDAATKDLTDAQAKLVKKTTSDNDGNNNGDGSNSGNNGSNNTGDNGSNSGNSGNNSAGGNNSGTGTNSGDSANNSNSGNKTGNQTNGNVATNSTKPSSNKDGRIGNTAAGENSLPQTGEVNTPTTLLGIILVGIASIGTFLFKRKQTH